MYQSFIKGKDISEALSKFKNPNEVKIVSKYADMNYMEISEDDEFEIDGIECDFENNVLILRFYLRVEK